MTYNVFGETLNLAQSIDMKTVVGAQLFFPLPPCLFPSPPSSPSPFLSLPLFPSLPRLR